MRLTVAELIKELQEFPQDMEVVTFKQGVGRQVPSPRIVQNPMDDIERVHL